MLAALEVAALWLSWRGLQSGQMRWSLAAAAVMGLAFNVKLAEMLIALPAMALLWLWTAAPGKRVRAMLACAATFLIVALSWTMIASLTPTSGRPFPIGSSNGSIWHVTLIYDGLSRLSSKGATGAAGGGAGALRLLSAGPSQYWTLIGIALLATCLLGLAAFAVLVARDRERLRGALREPAGRLVVGVLVWFATGLIAFSAMQRLQPRYLEAFASAVCAVFGLSFSVLWNHGLGRRSSDVGPGSVALDSFSSRLLGGGALASRIALVCAGVGLLAVSLSKSSYLVGRARSDSLLTDFSTPSLSRYLRAHRDGTHYEVASANVNDMIGLIARDDQPVLVLNSVDGSLTRTKNLQTQVVRGRVHFYFAAPHACHEGSHCPGNQIWAFAHSRPVPDQSGLRRFSVF